MVRDYFEQETKNLLSAVTKLTGNEEEVPGILNACTPAEIVLLCEADGLQTEISSFKACKEHLQRSIMSNLYLRFNGIRTA